MVQWFETGSAFPVGTVIIPTHPTGVPFGAFVDRLSLDWQLLAPGYSLRAIPESAGSHSCDTGSAP